MNQVPNVVSRPSVEQSALDELKLFFEFSEEDIHLLNTFHIFYNKNKKEMDFSRPFYEHILSFSSIGHLQPNNDAHTQMKALLFKNFDSLTSGVYDSAYVAQRTQVGHLHHQLGVDLKWYVGAYRKFISSLLPVLHEAFKGETQVTVTAALDALIKVAFFDMALALSAYFDDEKQTLSHMANHDALTGLPNRNLLGDRLSQSIRAAERRHGLVGVIVLDLDNFKKINDSLGHLIGDQVILIMAKRLTDCLRENDTVARWGGDEFVIVLNDGAQDISSVVNKLAQSIRQPFILGGTELLMTASMGIALYPTDGADQDELLKNADTAMYLAKGPGGRDAYRFYQPEMNADAAQKLKLEAGLRHALERNELCLYYLPEIDADSGKIIEIEALIRWESETGLVTSDQIIPIAEETGLIIVIGEWVLRTACTQVATFNQAGQDIIRVAVNVSERQFRHRGFVEMVAQVLIETGCEPAWLQIEITESMMMGKPDETLHLLERLAKLGVSLAIDDFGTGYSSLSYLKRIPINFLKIDRSFVHELSNSPDDAAIVNAVIGLGRSLGLKVVAEGVENATQLNYLYDRGCHLAQGFYFSQPKSVADIAQIVAAQRGFGCKDLFRR